jgi:hypothetical protein
MTTIHTSEAPTGGCSGENATTGPKDEADQVGPYWDIRVGRGGKLTATLTETQPPLVLTADDEESLRKQIKTLIMRAML